jgi:hypothetical protein
MGEIAIRQRQESPLSATAHFADKNAAICAVLLLSLDCHLLRLPDRLFSVARSKLERAERRRMP